MIYYKQALDIFLSLANKYKTDQKFTEALENYKNVIKIYKNII